jgi:hypothetical protein
LVRSFSSLPCVACNCLGVTRRIQLQLAKTILESESSSAWLPSGEDCIDHADRLLFVDRFSLLAFSGALAPGDLLTVGHLLCRFSVWNAMGAFGSASALPSVSEARDQSGTGWIGIQNLPGLERNRADLRRGTHAIAHPRTAYQLVQYTTLDVSRYFMGLSVCRLGSGFKKEAIAGFLQSLELFEKRRCIARIDPVKHRGVRGLVVFGLSPIRKFPARQRFASGVD